MKNITKEELFKLIDAGYTKEDINNLLEPAEEAEQAEPEPAESEPAAADAADDNETSSERTSNTEPSVITDSYIKQLQQAVKDLTAAVHRQNINSDDSSGRDTVRTDEDIIANVIYGGKSK